MSDFNPPPEPGYPPPDRPPGWGQAPAPSPWGPEGTQRDQPPGHHPPPGYHGAEPGYYTPAGQPPFHAYGVPVGYPRQSQAVAALILAIFGFFCCGLPAVVGMIMGRQDMQAIDQGRTDPTQRGTAQAAFVVGLVITIFYGLALAFYILAFIAAAGSLV